MNVQEFNLKELFNNSKGKTSLMLVMAAIFGLASAFGFIICGNVLLLDAFLKNSVNTDINTYSLQCVALATITAALLGARRFTKDKEVTSLDTTPPTE